MHVIFLFVLWVILAIMQIVLSGSDAIETLLMDGLIIMVGLGGLYSFIGHLFFSGKVAVSIGWPQGNPFQSEVAMANLAIGVLGILSYWIHYYFWIATVVAFSVFMLGTACIHIRDMRKSKNFTTGNAGPVFFADIGMPLILIILLVIYIRPTRIQ
ncbi:MAG: hypothetical protein NT082_02160 [Chloroflexi bacterium]|nr:hypothetical protein [Chloroflexota bacterium]